MNEKETHECTACSCDYTDDEGGIQGNFGILPMSFCPTCLSSIFDMVDQLNPKEWLGLDGSDWNDFNPLISNDPHRVAEWVEKILKERNGF